jgi:hypothetical protein
MGPFEKSLEDVFVNFIFYKNSRKIKKAPPVYGVGLKNHKRLKFRGPNFQRKG